MIAINQEYATDEMQFSEQDEIAIIPVARTTSIVGAPIFGVLIKLDELDVVLGSTF